MHLIILSLWDVHFFSDITVGIRHFLKSLIRPTSRSVHEIFLGWAEQALDATKTIPADDDLGKAVMVTDRHDWNWDRLRVQDGLISSSVRHHRGKQSGAVWERVAPSRRTNDHRTWAFFLSSQSAMQAMLPGLDVPRKVGISHSTKQGFRVENTSTHSVREKKRNPSTTDFFVACCY